MGTWICTKIIKLENGENDECTVLILASHSACGNSSSSNANSSQHQAQHILKKTLKIKFSVFITKCITPRRGTVGWRRHSENVSRTEMKSICCRTGNDFTLVMAKHSTNGTTDAENEKRFKQNHECTERASAPGHLRAHTHTSIHLNWTRWNSSNLMMLICFHCGNDWGDCLYTLSRIIVRNRFCTRTTHSSESSHRTRETNVGN